MFTGIIEALRPVADLHRAGQWARLAVDLGPVWDDTRVGDSIAIDGACLTVAGIEGGVARFDVSLETLSRTTLGRAAPGSRVNVERALKVGDRLGGHFVQGHVDGVASITGRNDQPGQTVIRFGVCCEVASQMIMKGSVAVDGISLTVSALGSDFFEVTLIPHTLDMTTLGFKGRGDRVNIETDLIGKWVRRLLGADRTLQGDITIDRLRAEGYL